MMFYTQFGENRPKGSKQAFTKPSLTEPDNTMSIPEIIARYTRGQGIAVNQHPWSVGAAAEEGEQTPPEDTTIEAVLGLEVKQPAEPAEPEPSAAAAPAAAPAAPADPAAAPAPAPSAGA